MKYSNSHISIENKQVKQVNKTTALKMFNNGKKIYLHPSNMTLNNYWQKPMLIQLDESEPLFKYCGYSKGIKFFMTCKTLEDAKKELRDDFKKRYQFDNVLNSFENYNCCSERGKYANFFAEIN
tara:strand:+ start:177 stop:548 length:372 start_codon:yes stop_codon:yes gene_type:complete